MELNLKKNDRNMMTIIGILSVAIPLAVAFLLFIPQSGKLGDLDVRFLPHLNAVMNSATALCLIGGFIAIKAKNIVIHRTLMVSAFILSSIFLLSYVLYHFQGEQMLFGDVNYDKVVDETEKLAVAGTRSVYLFVLFTHIVLSTIVVPFVLLAVYFAFSKQIERHKKIVKWTFPIWLYVAVTGVVVYFMMTPYYQAI